MIRGVLLDMSGVLYVGDKALPGAVAALERLRGAGLPLRFVTNTTTKPKRRLVELMAGMGFAVTPEEIFTPVAAARAWMAAEGRRPHLLIHPALAEDFEGCAEAGPSAVVVGDAGRGFTYDALNTAFRELVDGAPMLALAQNRAFMDADGTLSLDAGAFVKALEYASGTAPILLGKPAPGFFAAAAESMGLALADVAMVGDDAEADVAGALSAGVGMGALVRTGKYREGDEAGFDPRPTAVVADLTEAAERILS